MKINVTLNAPVEFLYQQLIESALEDIRKQVGKKISWHDLPNYTYEKKWVSGRVAKMHIDSAIPSQAYGYTMTTADQEFIVEYRLKKKDDTHTILEYTEDNHAKDAKVKANQNIGAFTLGWLRKHRFKKMARKMAEQYYK